MQRRILIIDDHDDLTTALTEVFEKLGHLVVSVESRKEALVIDNINDFDLVITDLDAEDTHAQDETAGKGAVCLPDISSNGAKEHFKVFKICASNFRLDNFQEDELSNFVETILNYKAQFVDNSKSFSIFTKELNLNCRVQFPPCIQF